MRSVALIGLLLSSASVEAVTLPSWNSMTGGGDPWAFSLMEVQGSRPGARQGHAAVEVGHKIYVIGGCEQEIQCYNDVNVFDTGSQQWSKEEVTGEAPEPRGGHTATLVGSDIILFGGANSEETFGDVYRFDLSRKKWTRLQNPSDAPSKRTSHAAALDTNGRIYTYGGYDAEANFLNDLWILKAPPSPPAGQDEGEASLTVTWAKPVPTGTVPMAREGHSLTLVDNKLVLFGGYTSGGHVANDAHAYDPQSQAWQQLDISGALPSPRQAHSAIRHGHDLVIAGGCEVSEEHPKCFNDVWALNLIDMQWSQRSSGAAGWMPREGHTASFVGGKMYSFGGCQLGSDCFADISVLDTMDPCPAACGHHGQCVDGAHCQCTEPGFTGHDCMQPLTCQQDCGLHGACGQDGQCVCTQGWSGEGCSQPPRCPGSPLPCNGRGACTPHGKCVCQPGASGEDCFDDVVIVASDGKNSGQGFVVASSRSKKQTSLLALGSSDHLSQGTQQGAAVEKSVVQAAQVSAKNAPATEEKKESVSTGDFGVAQVNKIGHLGEKDSVQCKDNCNWRGLCDGGVCFCQPGYSGGVCEIERVSNSGTLGLPVVLVLTGATLVGSCFSTFILLGCLNRSRKDQAELAGYEA
eukprot:TRINITY_DN93164_c0_g1_i1.p1 TRINITY_DN93164_c0_g1~~TRINITY_DN93164_c0_g1_i1.p1  ORF type:complete len:634 (+),score=132.81 TRINITY_DN93164_c0_g1_i1:122-2023(+)